MKFLVLGATGTVGSNVVRELLARRHQVRILTRNPDKASSLGANLEVVTGDLLDLATLSTIFRSMDGAFLLNAVGQTESHEGLMAVSAAMTAGLKRLVYMSVHHADAGAYLPHFGSKIGIEAAIQVSGISSTILRPNNFFQNDTWFRDPMIQYGVYPQPLGDMGVSRVDIRDIAEAAAIALTEAGHGGKTYNLVGPEPLTGAKTAAIWSDKLGRKVIYGGNDLDAWEKQALQMLPASIVYDLKLMYALFQKNGLIGSDQDIATMSRLLGHAPRNFDDFATEAAASWASEGSAVGRRS